MRTKCYNVYKFAELSDKGKENAISNLRDINVKHEWWDATYADAQNIGIKITSFSNYLSCEGKFLSGALETAHKIEKEHGADCETFKTTKEFLAERDEIVDTAPKDHDTGEFQNETELDHKLDEIEGEYLKSLLEDYRIMLDKEMEYLISDEVIKETIEANDYDFTQDGKLA